MLLERIEALREKPRAVRDQYAFAIAAGVTALIALVWAISLPARMSFEEAIVVEEGAVPPAGPAFTQELGNLRTMLGEGIEEAKTQAEIIGSVPTVEEEDPQIVAPPVSPEETAHYDFFPPPTENTAEMQP